MGHVAGVNRREAFARFGDFGHEFDFGRGWVAEENIINHQKRTMMFAVIAYFRIKSRAKV